MTLSAPGVDPAAVAAAWREAQDLWGVRVHPPTEGDAGGAVAAFGFPTAVVYDRAQLQRQGAVGQLASVFAHEIGHHVAAPATRVVSAQLQRVIGEVVLTANPDQVAAREITALVANLWADMLVNDRVRRLQQASGAASDIADVYRGMNAASAKRRHGAPTRLWTTVMRAFEVLWTLVEGDLATLPADREARAAVEDDARVLAQTVRTFADDPVGGALPAALVLVPLAVPDGDEALCHGAVDGRALTDAEVAEVIAGLDARADVTALPVTTEPGTGQGFDLARTLELFDAASAPAVIRGWYLAKARPHRRRLRTREPRPLPVAELPGPLETWEAGDDLAELDVRASLAASPVLVPGVTTRRRTMLDDPTPPPESPVDLDLYVDVSGSMPRIETGSPAALAAVILVDGAIAGGGRVRVTTFSSAGDVAGTPEFSRDRDAALRAALVPPHGGTVFPLDLYAQRYARPQHPRPHVVVLSDDGMRSMFGAGQEEHAEVAAAVRARLASATLVLVVPEAYASAEAAEAGYAVLATPRMDEVPAACAQLVRRILDGGAG